MVGTTCDLRLDDEGVPWLHMGKEGAHMRDTIDMAREAGVRDCTCSGSMGCLKAFEALVRADERKEMQVESEADKVIIEYHEATIKRLEAAILAEREACAKVCEDLSLSQNSEWEVGTLDCADAIRNRGNT
jgi:hypothetical protein